MMPENKFQFTHPKKGNCANLPPGKVYLEIETSEKNDNQGVP